MRWVYSYGVWFRVYTVHHNLAGLWRARVYDEKQWKFVHETEMRTKPRHAQRDAEQWIDDRLCRDHD